MNLSDLSVEGLTQLEVRLAADLEMVKRVKALVMEYQKMGMRSEGSPGGSAVASALGILAASAPATPLDNPDPAMPRKSIEERLMEALASTSPAGFILGDLRDATYSPPHGCVDKDTTKSWVKNMVRKGRIRVVETRTGRIGNVYAAVRSESSETEG